MKRGLVMLNNLSPAILATEINWGLVGSTVVTGLVIVFLILAILVFFLWAFGKIFKLINAASEKKERQKLISRDNSANKSQSADAKKESSPAQTAVPDIGDDDYDEDDDEIIAVIAAAIAAYGASEGKQYRIASIRRSRSASSGWKAAGISDNMRGFAGRYELRGE